MDNTTIKIVIDDGSGQSSGTATSPEAPGSSPNPNEPTTQKEEKGQEDSAITIATGVHIAKQALNMATTRVGQITRSSVLQDRVNATLKGIGYITAIASNPVMGTIALGFDLINSSINYSQNASAESNRLTVLSQRAGNSVNRSR